MPPRGHLSVLLLVLEHGHLCLLLFRVVVELIKILRVGEIDCFLLEILQGRIAEEYVGWNILVSLFLEDRV